MAVKSKHAGTGLAFGVGAGAILSLLMTLIGAAAVTFLIAAERIGEDQLGYGAGAAIFIGALVGALTAVAMAGEKRLIVCGLHAAVYFVILLCCTAMFFDGRYDGIGVTAMLILGANGAVWLLGMRRDSRGRGRVKMPKFR